MTDKRTNDPAKASPSTPTALSSIDEILSQAFTDGASDTMWQNDRHVEIFATAKAKLEALIQEAVNETSKAYGGCTKCYGKGYATVRDGTIGYEDFGGDGFKTPVTTRMKYCTCDRGTQLKALNTKENK